MSIWPVTPGARRLRDWQVIEVEGGSRHVSAYSPEHREGRMTSAIMSFDATTAQVVTASGACYELQGRPGGCLDTEYVRQRWLALNKVAHYVFVTDEYVKAIEAARNLDAPLQKSPRGAANGAPDGVPVSDADA